MDVVIHGADTETYLGRPMTLQFFSEQTREDLILFVDETTATKGFIEWLDSLQPKVCHVVYVHNLEFDLPEFLWSVKEKLVTAGGEFSFDIGQWHFQGVYSKPTFCRISNRRKNTQVTIVDSFLWYQGSLANAAKLYCPNLPKLKRPHKLGERKFGIRDDGFVAYAMRDAEVAYHIGVAVQKIVREFNIRQPVSLADMAAKIFRHAFLNYTIPQPGSSVILAALNSYHGGKNNVIPGAFPAWHQGITSMDISSAYPYAMSQLPAFSNKRLYKRYPKSLGHVREVPPFGVYCVSGTVAESPYPCVFTHGFKPIHGAFRNTWIQGIELNEALASGKLKIKSIRGTYYEAERDHRDSAFASFVSDFYSRKSNEREPVQRYGYKTILNSTYGKFIQTRKNQRISYTDIDSNETVEANEVIAGGMFHPFIASAITAHTRAYIHQIEQAHNAIHTATDGIYTYAKRPKRVPLGVTPNKGLGSLTVEGSGDLLLVRNKCYILYGDKPLDEHTRKSMSFRGKYIYKHALHGFQGNVYDLERLIAKNKRKYVVTRPNKLRESMQRGLEVNRFQDRDFVLKVGPIVLYSR